MYGKSNIHSVHKYERGKNDNSGQSEAAGWGTPLRNPLVSGVAEWRTPPGRGGRSPAAVAGAQVAAGRASGQPRRLKN